MKNITFILALALICAAPSYAKECFNTRQQQYIYERGVSAPQENAKITACLKNNLTSGDLKSFDKDVASLKKSNNIGPVAQELLNIFRQSKSPTVSFTAASGLISASYDLGKYEPQILNILTSQAQDYKKTLAVIMLASMESADYSYAAYLAPALNAQDPVLKAYASGAYSIIIPGGFDELLEPIIMLYTFDKDFAKKAFISTGLKDRALESRLKTLLKSEDETTRIAAIEWIGDIGDKKLLSSVIDTNYNLKYGLTLSAVGNAMASNYPDTEADLKKAFKKDPSSSAATVAVMAFAFMGGEGYNYIDEALKTGTNNEKANALRVISSVAGILAGDASYYTNPALEKQKIRKFITPVAKINNEAKNTQVKTYADNASKELYKLLNN